ncbi:hypothetical protein SteCoe_14912 [Stentor coeruleus]|uniref:Protein kinase domain-containing protein n=1 Tax=Stentor coeruleus TaxID=5963 RepID=A0A1R2C4U5_9CILI|nr:hypothetical protein SteCoe_14912 [Stentor coeruleus]
MGQLIPIEQSAFKSLAKEKHHYRSSTVMHKKTRLPLKTIRIRYYHNEKVVYLEDNFLTCGWLLSEAIRLFPEAHPIVALRTADNIDVIDVWLQDFERSLNIIKDNTTLIPISGQGILADISMSWFEPVAVLGKGGFSNVFLVRKRDTGYLYALKVMQKDFILKENKAKHVIAECSIMRKLSHPFINQLRWAFQTNFELLMVTDFCPGGELFFHLHNLGRFTEDQARFYFSEIILAIEYLHRQRIIFRDLKPENTLIDIDGHIKLIDFGSAKVDLGDRQNSFCGTHEYLSPEMIKRNGYNKSVDFYSLGSFLYEMLTGFPPFWDKDKTKLYDKILNEDIKIPKYLSRNAQTLVRGLLRKDPMLRIGSILGIKEVKCHPWLENVNWESVYNKTVIPPFRPNSSKSNFETENILASIKDPVFDRVGFFSPAKDMVFEDFYYVSEEKTKNHELTVTWDIEDQTEISKSFIEMSPMRTCKECESPELSKMPLNTSYVKMLDFKCQKIGPELTCAKVKQKFLKKDKSTSNAIEPRKSESIQCSKSFVNSRKSVYNPRLGMD